MCGRLFPVAALLLGLAGLCACGSSGNPDTPVVCLQGPDAYLTALADAPQEVRLGGKTLISDCVVAGQDAGELATAGRSMVTAATKLNALAREDPGGPAPVQLGYLLGAVSTGASDTGGIHADLLRRLEAGARFSTAEPLPAALRRSFDEGYAAGRRSG